MKFNGSKLKQIRQGRGQKPEVLAAAVGVTADSIKNWEDGKNVPGAEHLAKLAMVTGKPMAYFFEGNGQ